jgi:hypothetical protein
MKQFSDEQYLRALLRQDFHAFAQQCFSYLYGKRLAPNWHIEAVCWHLTKAVKGTVTRSIINIPPRHLKSFCASVCLPAWILLHDPSAKVICVSYAQSLASNFSLMFRRILQASWYRKLAQVRIDPRKNSEEEIATLQGGYRLATSIGGQLTGRGAQYIIIDDPMKADQAMSEAERTAVLDWYSSALTTRLDDKIGGGSSSSCTGCTRRTSPAMSWRMRRGTSCACRPSPGKGRSSTSARAGSTSGSRSPCSTRRASPGMSWTA